MGCQPFPPTPYQVCGAILDKYLQTGGPQGFLLLPKSNELTNPDGIGKRSEFLGGNIYWSPATGAHPVAHDFLTKWGDYGYEAGFIGYPTTDEVVLNSGRRQEFQGASIYWSPLTGAHNIQGAIRQEWIDLGADRSALGYPTSDEVVTPDGNGRFNRFQNGMIYWSPATGAHAVSARILEIWAHNGYEKSQWGYPVGEVTGVEGDPGAQIQSFEGGTIYVNGGMFRGLLVPAAEFNSLDTTLHPNYCKDPLHSPPSCPVDLSEYDTEPDPTGEATKGNREAAGVVEVAFQAKGETHAGALWDHFYANSGLDYPLDASILDPWLAESDTDYAGSTPPAVRANDDRSAAITEATTEADRQGKAVKCVVSTDRQVPTSGISNDHVHSLGRYSVSSTTAVIAQPQTAAGTHTVDLRQQIHMYDVYDFNPPAGGEDNEAREASRVGQEGTYLGIAKPFLVYGSGSVQSWSGQR